MRPITLLPLLAVAFLAAGCGGKEDDDETASVSAAPIELGIYDFERNVITPPGTEDAASQGFPTEAAARKAAKGKGAIVVRSVNRDAGTVQYFVLRDEPAVTEDGITDTGTFTAPDGKPGVRFQFTEQGGRDFQALTAEIARRAAAEAERDTQSGLGGMEHFAIVADGDLLSLPTLDFEQYPDGIGGEAGVQISGNFTQQEAEELAAALAASAPDS